MWGLIPREPYINGRVRGSFQLNLFIDFYVHEWFACLYVGTPHACRPTEARRGHPLGLVPWEGLLEEQPVHSTAQAFQLTLGACWVGDLISSTVDK